MDIENKKDEELQEALVEVRKRKRKKTTIAITAIVIIVLLLFGMVWLYGYNYSKNKTQGEIDRFKKEIERLVNTPIVVEPITPEIVQTVLNSNITDFSELASAEYIFTNAAKYTASDADSWLPAWLTEKTFIQKWDGIIKAGIDLKELKISVSENIITITMPPAKILSYEVDPNSVEILDEENNVINPLTMDDKVKFDAQTAEAMKARAIENGLLEKAQKNTEQIIKSMLTSSIEDIAGIEFVVTEATADSTR